MSKQTRSRLPYYGIFTPLESSEQESIKARIFRALALGWALTPASANTIGNTTDGTRYLRYIEADGYRLDRIPHTSSNGGRYFEYKLQADVLAEIDEYKNKLKHN